MIDIKNDSKPHLKSGPLKKNWKWNVTLCMRLLGEMSAFHLIWPNPICTPILPPRIRLSAVKGQNIDSESCNGWSSRLIEIPKCVRRRITCACWNVLGMSSYKSARWQLHRRRLRCRFPVFMWFPNNLGLPTVPHKNVEGAITLPAVWWMER